MEYEDERTCRAIQRGNTLLEYPEYGEFEIVGIWSEVGHAVSRMDYRHHCADFSSEVFHRLLWGEKLPVVWLSIRKPGSYSTPPHTVQMRRSKLLL